jgi:hypothetical protein
MEPMKKVQRNKWFRFNGTIDVDTMERKVSFNGNQCDSYKGTNGVGTIKCSYNGTKSVGTMEQMV